jgi:hypothetical protein
MASYEKTLAPLTVAAFMNCCLFTLETTEVFHYYRTYQKDNRAFKWTVAWAYLVDLATTVAACSLVYLYAVKSWGNLEEMAQHNWPIGIVALFTQISALIVQVFLLHRLSKLSRNWFIILPLFAMGLGAFAVSTYTSVYVLVRPAFGARTGAVTMSLTYICLSTVADIGIAAALIYQLRQSIFRSASSRWEQFVRFLTVVIETGISGSVVSLIAMIVFALDNLSTVPVGLFFLIGRVYTLTMMRNLNVRDSHKEGADGRSNTQSLSSRRRGSSVATKDSHVSESPQIELQAHDSKAKNGASYNVESV